MRSSLLLFFLLEPLTLWMGRLSTVAQGEQVE